MTDDRTKHATGLEHELDLALFARAIDSTTTGVVIGAGAAADHRILYANPTFLHLSGYPRDEILGRNCRFLQGPDTSRDSIAEIREAVRAERPFVGELLNYKKDGTPFWNRLTVTPISGTTEETYFVGIQEDVTRRRNAERKQSELLDRLAEVNRSLEDFTYIVSHDLKAPLRAIGALTGLLRADYGEIVGGEGRGLMSLMEQRIERMVRLIDDLLLYAKAGWRAEAGAMVDIGRLVAEVWSVVDPEGRVTLEANALPTLWAPELSLRQVFQNLLSNAFKFLGPRGGRVEVRATEHSEEWVFSVKDDGLGIEARFFERIFEPFQKLDSRDAIEGSGAGLAIVKKLVEGAGGRVWVTSTPGLGSEFFVALPKPQRSMRPSQD
jgi:two-component system, LuxR family, sensor kinase FixL